MKEIKYTKYKSRGPGFHYDQIDCCQPMAYNSYMAARHQLVAEFLEKNQNLENEKLMDLGCGDGVLISLLAKRGAKTENLYGVDLDETAIFEAKKRNSGAHFSAGSAYEVPFEDGKFGVVCSIDVIEHLAEEERYLKEIKRVLKKDGLVIIGTPIKMSEAPLDKTHIKEYIPLEFKKKMSGYFKLKSMVYTHKIKEKKQYEKKFTFLRKEIYLNRLLVNLKSIIFKNNPFLKTYQQEKNCSYMFFIGTNE